MQGRFPFSAHRASATFHSGAEVEAQREIMRLEQSLRQMDDEIHILEDTVRRQAKAVGIL